MNNVTMGGMNNMGGPVGGGMPIMNNGAAPVNRPVPTGENQKSQLNTYIYEYFLRNGMFDCARSLLNSQVPMNIIRPPQSPGSRRDENGNGVGDEGGDVDSKDDIDAKRPSDLPDPNLPKECPESCFLYEWWCLFWDMFNAQRGKGDGRNVMQYVHHTQAQSRMRQEQQQAMLRGLRGDMLPQQYQQMMMRNGPNNMNLTQNELRQKAIQNNRNNPQQMQMLAQQKQNQMQRGPSDGNEQQRPQSPGSAENAPSPSKRPRLDGTPNFNPQQMPNGRGQGGVMPQQVGDTGPSSAIQAAHMQLTNGIEPNNLTAQQFQNIPVGPNASAQARSVAGYQQNLVQQQAQQAGQLSGVKPMPNPGGPQNQGSPMMTGGQDGGAIANYYNPGEMGPNGMRGGPGGQPGGGGGNHALQDYQMQLMLLEQQNKKRLMMARQEQDNMMPNRGEGGQGPPGAGGPGQPFQGTSPQGPRSVNSPAPGDQMKRGTPHMNNAGMPSPLPEGQSRGSPSNGMNFGMAGGPIDPNMTPQYFKMNGMDPNMVGGMPNGMRPPSSHPGGFNNQMTPQQMQMARQQQQQQQAAVQNNWQQGGPNGQMMPQAGAQGPPQQMGTPQQRAMPPPSAPATGAAANGRATSSPQQNPAPPTPSQANKPNPKKKNENAKDKAKRATKKGSTQNLNAGATPVADDANAGATPTPATPITPVHAKSFNNGQNGAVQPVQNGQPSAQAPNAGGVSQQPGMSENFVGNLGEFGGAFDMDFANNNNPSMDVLQDFDFDSFLHQDGGVEDNFNFDAGFLDGNEIGAD